MSAETSQGTAPGQAACNGPTRRRRKIRKGTFSCWECKRRKKRCQFQSTSELVCASCQRLGVECVGQDVSEPIEHGDHETEKRLADIEALVARLERQREDRWHPQSRSTAKERPFRNDVDNFCGKGSSTFLPAQITASPSSRYNMLKGFMISVLPAPGTANAIIAQGQSPLAVLETSSAISMAFGTEGKNLQVKHPIKLAQGLIHLALCLERLNLEQTEAIEDRLKAPRSVVARKYVDAAHHVTCQDSLMESFDSLELLMLESSFEMSTGNVKSAWLNVRRALNIAQVMDRNRIPRHLDRREHSVHLRLVLFDRVLSLMLGCSFESSASEHWMSKQANSTSLEQTHADISGQLIGRNVRMQQRLNRNDEIIDGYNDYEQTRNIDRELKSAMRTFTPLDYADIPTVKTDIAAHYVDQMHHYDLLVLTHLPYLLKGPHLQQSAATRINFDYSRTVAVFAAREVLSRVLMCCKSPRIPNLSGGLSHKTYISTIVVLLAHMSGQQMGSENVLEYQRPQDLKLVVDIMKEMSHLSDAKRGIFDAHVITELMAVEQNADNGHLYDAWTAKSSEEDIQPPYVPSNARLRFDLPYLGTISIRPRQSKVIPPSDLRNDIADMNVNLATFETLGNSRTSPFVNYSETWSLEDSTINWNAYLG